MNRIFGVLSFKEAHGEYQGELLAEPQFNRHQTLKRQDNPESDDNAVDSLTMRKGDQMGINQEKMGNVGVVVHKKKKSWIVAGLRNFFPFTPSPK